MPKAPVFSLLLIALATLAIAACSTASDATVTPTPGLGPTSTPISQAQLDRAFAGFEEATDVFNEEAAVSAAVIEKAAVDGRSDEEIDRLIRREAMRQVRLAGAIKSDADQRLGSRGFRITHDSWVRDRITDALGWMRTQQATRFDSMPEYPLATADGILSELLPFVVDRPEDFLEGLRHIDLFMTAARSESPFSSSVAVTGAHASPAHLTVRGDGRPVFTPETGLDLNGRRLAWSFNPDTMPELLAALESDSLGEQSQLVYTYTASLFARDRFSFERLDGEPQIYEETARAILADLDLAEIDYDKVTRTGASRLIRNEAEAINAQISFLQRKSVGAADIASLIAAIKDSDLFAPGDPGLAVLTRELSNIGRYMSISEESPGKTPLDAILVTLANDMIGLAELGSLLPADRNAMLTEAVSKDIADGVITLDSEGAAQFDENSFLFHRRYYDYEFAFFPEFTRILRANRETLDQLAASR